MSGLRAVSAIPRKRAALPPGLLLAGLPLLVFAAHAPSLAGGFLWDDSIYYVNHPAMTAPPAEAFRAIWLRPDPATQYYPLLFTMFRAERAIWGLSPAGPRAANLLLHGLAALLAGVWLRRRGVPGALLAAGLFALHPVMAESADWITERKNTLSGFFAALCLLARDRAESGGGALRWRAASFLAFVAALLSKAAVLPLAAFLALDEAARNPGRGGGLRRAAGLAPFFLAGAAIAIVHSRLEVHNVAIVRDELDAPPAERLAVAGRALWFYAGKLMWPSALMPVYPRWEVRSGGPAIWIWPALAAVPPVALFALRRRLGSGPWLAAAFFGLMVSPALTFIPQSFNRASFAADHFQYHAAAGLLALMGALGASLRPPDRPRLAAASGRSIPGAPLALAAAVLTTLGALSFVQAGHYRSELAFWSNASRMNPKAWLAHYNLGVALEDAGERLAAAEAYRASIRERPDFLDPHLNLGALLAEEGRIAEALRHFRIAEAISPDHPNVRQNLETVRGQLGAGAGSP